MNFYQDVFFRLTDQLRGRRTIQRLHELRKSQFWSQGQIETWQLDRLNALLHQAKQYSPYYQQKLEGLELPLKALSDISQIPILYKTDIRENQLELRCTNVPPERFVQSRTGGSTAEPMFYYWDKRGMDWNRASVYRAAEWGNTALGEKTLQMSGSHFDYTQSESLKTKVTLFLQRYKDLSVAFLTEELLENYFQELLRYKPTSIWGYAGGQEIFADYISSEHADADLSFVKAIMTSSEMLWPHQREKINKAFQGEKVFDQYGARELYMASECDAHDGYHVHAEVIFAEIVDDDGNWCAPGESGRVILTDLSNHAFPFIRYEIGDLASMNEPSQCSCGRWLPRLQGVQGRIADVIKLSDRKLTAPNFATLFSDKPGVEAYQIRQDRMEVLEVVMVPDENYSDEFENYIRGSIESIVPDDTEVKIIIEKEIKVPESGKRRYVVSNLK